MSAPSGCARVIAGYGGKDGYTLAQGGEFAYLQLDKLNAADVVLDATPAHAAALLALRNTATAPNQSSEQPVQMVAKGHDWLLVLCTESTPQALARLTGFARPTWRGPPVGRGAACQVCRALAGTARGAGAGAFAAAGAAARARGWQTPALNIKTIAGGALLISVKCQFCWG